MSDILSISPKGKLRLRKIGSSKGVVELLCGDEWVYCGLKSLPLDKARKIFEKQVEFHEGVAEMTEDLFQEWYSQLTELFLTKLSRHPSSAGWEWKAIYEEGLTPLQAFTDYIETL
uniref:Uncharacterized protein n=1 Tax=Ochrobactrum phage ORM_20 TaxID=2985243 RepID=A0A9N6WZK6_9VIRU|nr:hypothetical protein ORM20_00189 [Ochrobactrum phage ORM_20]